MWDSLWTGAMIATCASEEKGYGLLKNAAIAIENEKIAWIGECEQLPKNHAAKITHDISGFCITPGLIDSHTHLIYAGNRAHEFALRLNGASYEEIARAGGGILSTVNATRAASVNELVQQSLPRLQSMLKQGVTTVEIKSGYGLDLANECKILEAARILAEKLPVTICPTFLGAHAIPAEYKNRADDYIDLICHTILPVIAEKKLATAVDGFCEKIGFSVAQMEKVFQAAAQYNLPVKLHAEQLSDSAGTQLAARYHALSADHLEYVSKEGVQAMAKAKMAAVLLPGAYYFLRETKMPPLQLLREYQIPIALATDCNPGTSPTTSLLLMMNMACTLWRMTTEEVLRAVTINAAQALNLHQHYGSLEIGKKADFVVWDVQHPDELSYRFGDNLCRQVIKHGQEV